MYGLRNVTNSMLINVYGRRPYLTTLINIAKKVSTQLALSGQPESVLIAQGNTVPSIPLIRQTSWLTEEHNSDICITV